MRTRVSVVALLGLLLAACGDPLVGSWRYEDTVDVMAADVGTITISRNSDDTYTVRLDPTVGADPIRCSMTATRTADDGLAIVPGTPCGSQTPSLTPRSGALSVMSGAVHGSITYDDGGQTVDQNIGPVH